MSTSPTPPTPDGLRTTLAQLRRELAADLALLRGGPTLAPLERRGAELDRFVADLDAQLERSGSAAVVTLVGSTGAGKSTLLNALVGQAVATPGTDRPTTTRPVVYRPHDADVGGLLEGLGAPPAVHDYAPGSAAGPWTGQVLVDAPDTNSVATDHRRTVELLAERSDALVVVAHRQSVAELASVAFVDAYRGRRDLCVVLNRTDELSDEARATLLAQLRELAADRWGQPELPVFTTSALAAWEAERRSPGSAAAEVPGWAELVTHLEGLVADGRLGRVRRDNALGTAALLAGLAREVADDVDPRLAGLVDACRSATAAFRARVEDELGARLELRRRDVALLLYDETARHWEGPGGWALRAGGLAGLGLGAGALVARRNPLLAAGTAIGAAALDRAQGALRGRRLEHGSGLVPTGHELGAWYRAAFPAPRQQALELFGDAEALDLPRPDQLGAAAAESVEAAWSRLVERDLVAAAGRGSRWYLRWPVDLPVYALLAWLVWQAGLGLYEGTSLGLDRLVDAAILALAWLALGRWLVRRLLGGAARSLVSGVDTDARAALADLEALAPAALESAVALRREALGRLARLDEHWRTRLHGSSGPARPAPAAPEPDAP